MRRVDRSRRGTSFLCFVRCSTPFLRVVVPDRGAPRVEKIKEQLSLVEGAAEESWQTFHNTGIVTDSPNVNRSARTKVLEADVFSFAYRCAAHALSNLCRDIIKMPAVLRVVSFCTVLAEFFHKHLLPRAHLIKQQQTETPQPPTLKLFSPTMWTETASLLTSVLKNRGSITTVLLKAKQRVINMDFPPFLFDLVMESDNWDNVAQWEPVLCTLSAITNYLQADTTPLSGVHACVLSLEASLVPSNFPLSIRDEIRGFIKLRDATIFSPAHVLSFYLDPVFVPFREMSRASKVKPYTMTDAAVCVEAAKRLVRTASEEEKVTVVMQVTQVLMGSFPLSRTGAVEESSRLSLPHVWWILHAEGAPPELRAVAAQMFSLAPTSSAGERSFKQRSRVHSKTRNRLSDDHAYKTQAIIFNKRQTRRFYGGALLQPRTTCAEAHMVGMLRRGCPNGSGGGDGNTIAGGNRVDGVVGARGDGVLEQGVFESEEEEALTDEDVGTVAGAQEAIARLIKEAEAENE